MERNATTQSFYSVNFLVLTKTDGEPGEKSLVELLRPWQLAHRINPQMGGGC